ncbi:ABC transporter ATP-binding protein [Marinomonas spartinae]|uniref:ABC transporter ATP-binding protein n=1 Tax=Marinomonas spartinae TaxID=1792290 RepID=UPI0018F124C8|nr:ABC transporter ATP-binding protein [Marinomonas spartinae]MBJ7555186.1 ABC transporter ATP-binding protein [Marinomonas spartinae]
MKYGADSSNHSPILALPSAARKRLLYVGLGWILVAALEAWAYTVLALGITHHWPPLWILISTGMAILVSIAVNRSGYLTGVRLAGDLYKTLGHALAQSKLSWFTHNNRTKIANIAGQGIPGFMSIPAHQLQSFLHAPCLPLCLVVGIGVVAGLEIALVASVLLILALLGLFLSQRALKRADAQRQTAQNNASAATLEFVDHLELLRTAAGPIKAIERIEQRWQAQEQALSKTNWSSAFAIFVSTLASVLPIAGMASFMVLQDDTNITTLLAVLMLIGRAAAPLGELATAGLSINDLKASLDNYKQATTAPQLPEPRQPKTMTSDHQIRIEGIAHGPVLNNINATIPAGSRVRILGPSGSGKSTLLELLMRFDDPEKGVITIGGVKLRDITYEELASHIAYVPQDPVVFTGTLADNIRIGNPTASDLEVETAARHASLDTIIDRSPDGIHQLVGQQGMALSGGERQRVTIARALIKKAPILILDEATSALDSTTEQAIVNTLHTLDATILFVTHKDISDWRPNQVIDLTGYINHSPPS